MQIRFRNRDVDFQSDLSQGVSLARPLSFCEDGSNLWNAPAPSAAPVEIDNFVGDTTQGGSCNVDQLSIIPHCHGTHTETVGHIVDDDVFVSNLKLDSLMPALVVTVEPILASKTEETYSTKFEPSDRVIAAAQLKDQLQQHEGFESNVFIVRTSQETEDSAPPYFTHEAMNLIVEHNVEHLLVDFPSIDRLEDGGALNNHRILWNVDPGSKQLKPTCRKSCTITELIQVPTEVTDGPCLLSLQLPAFESDAAPSRPVVYSITRV